MKRRVRIVLVNKTLFDALQAQVEREGLVATNGLACVVRGIDALASAGVVDRKWAKAVRSRGMALVRPPWVKKPVKSAPQLPRGDQ